MLSLEQLLRDLMILIGVTLFGHSLKNLSLDKTSGLFRYVDAYDLQYKA